MSADGTDIQQISFNQSHDLDPAVLDDGRIVFSRWDSAPGHDEMNLYAMRPDGTGLELLYGAQQPRRPARTARRCSSSIRARWATATCWFAPSRSSRRSAAASCSTSTSRTTWRTRSRPLPNRRRADRARAEAGDRQRRARPSTGRRRAAASSAAFPLRDGTGRLLVSWTQCRLLEGERDRPLHRRPARRARRGAGAAAVRRLDLRPVDADPAAGRESRRGRHVHRHRRAAAASPLPAGAARPGGRRRLRRRPRVRERRHPRHPQRLRHRRRGHGARRHRRARRPAPHARPRSAPRASCASRRRSSLPDRDVLDFRGSAFGVTAAFGMREILGYAPIEPDGSVRVKVPANVAVRDLVLDAERPAHRPAARQLAAGARRRGTALQWLPRPGERPVARSLDLFTVGERGRDHHRPAVPEHESRAVRRLRRDHGAGARAHQLPDRLRRAAADARHRVRGRLDRSGRRRPARPMRPSPTATRTSPRRRRRRRLRRRRGGRAAASRSTTSSTSIRCGAGRASRSPPTASPCWPTTPARVATRNRDRRRAPRRCPPGQLELTDGASADQPDHFHAYRELLATDNEQELADGVAAGPAGAGRRRSRHRGSRSSRPCRSRLRWRAGSANASVALLLKVRARRHPRRPPDARRVEAHLRMGRQRCAVLQRPVRRAGQLRRCADSCAHRSCLLASLGLLARPARRAGRGRRRAGPVPRAAQRPGPWLPGDAGRGPRRERRAAAPAHRLDQGAHRRATARAGCIAAQLERTLTPRRRGSRACPGPAPDAAREHRWEAGVGAGDFDGADVVIGRRRPTR